MTPGDVHNSAALPGTVEARSQGCCPHPAGRLADSAYDFPLAYWSLEEQGTAFFVHPQTVYGRPKAELKRDAFFYGRETDGLCLPKQEETAIKDLYRSGGAPRLVFTGREMPVRERQAGRQETAGQDRSLPSSGICNGRRSQLILRR